MAFEQIDTGSLNSSLDMCKNALNKGITENLIFSTMNDNIWCCDAKMALRNALEELSKLYNELESDIENCQDIAGEIEKYKQIEAKNVELNKEYNALSSKLWYEEEYEEEYYDDVTKKMDTRTETRTVKDENVEKQMTEIQAKIKENNEKLGELENTINNMI